VSFRVLHVLDHSWPVLDGYAQRSRAVVAAQAELGMQPHVLTSTLHQVDDPNPSELFLDGLRYSRTPPLGVYAVAINRHWPILREMSVVKLLMRRIEYFMKTETFDIVHAHSPALCGLAALKVAQRHRIPFVYEIRSFWEDSALNQKSAFALLKYRASRLLENYVLRRADAVVGIAQPMLQDIEARGIPSAKLFHVANGVDVSRFVPRSSDGALASALGLNGVPTLGFIGTLFPWEGVVWVIRAAEKLHQSGAKFKLLIVGDGMESTEVRKTIQDLGSPGYVSFVGRVPHDQVERYYSVIDVLVYPRIKARITELVTPLKPLEAMALEKAVLGSSVGGIRELIQPGVTGMLFEAGNVQDFCSQASRLLRECDLRRELGLRARQMVAVDKDWKLLVRRYQDIYEIATRNSRSHF
jgi:PEP-CTERM/exosortase A-associated glycosyltransferase